VPDATEPHATDGVDVVAAAAARATPTPDSINAMVLHEFPGTGNDCTEIGRDYAVARRLVAPADLRPGGSTSGPTQFSLADAALWYLVFSAISRVEPMALTSELSIRFLRPAVGETLWARATLDRAGRRNVVGTIRLWVDDDPAATVSVAQGTYALPAPSRA
jgi:uncharacterized protein (TIGR00369 family)